MAWVSIRKAREELGVPSSMEELLGDALGYTEWDGGDFRVSTEEWSSLSDEVQEALMEAWLTTDEVVKRFGEVDFDVAGVRAVEVGGVTLWDPASLG